MSSDILVKGQSWHKNKLIQSNFLFGFCLGCFGLVSTSFQVLQPSCGKENMNNLLLRTDCG